jgi:hypothetical protein
VNTDIMLPCKANIVTLDVAIVIIVPHEVAVVVIITL